MLGVPCAEMLTRVTESNPPACLSTRATRASVLVYTETSSPMACASGVSSLSLVDMAALCTSKTLAPTARTRVPITTARMAIVSRRRTIALPTPTGSRRPRRS